MTQKFSAKFMCHLFLITVSASWHIAGEALEVSKSLDIRQKLTTEFRTWKRWRI